ncbi:MAG: hypothetical protein JXA69_04635 [Phycisphaerae bacterium]|nr:hypothetical protein [Phycisphaerae bacterium]
MAGGRSRERHVAAGVSPAGLSQVTVATSEDGRRDAGRYMGENGSPELLA